jgi:hypothetical protein
MAFKASFTSSNPDAMMMTDERDGGSGGEIQCVAATARCQMESQYKEQRTKSRRDDAK